MILQQKTKKGKIQVHTNGNVCSNVRFICLLLIRNHICKGEIVELEVKQDTCLWVLHGTLLIRFGYILFLSMSRYIHCYNLSVVH